jgi:hypothetical protein
LQLIAQSPKIKQETSKEIGSGENYEPPKQTEVLVSQGNEQTLDIHMTEKEENPLEEKKEKKEH